LPAGEAFCVLASRRFGGRRVERGGSGWSRPNVLRGGWRIRLGVAKEVPALALDPVKVRLDASDDVFAGPSPRCQLIKEYRYLKRMNGPRILLEPSLGERSWQLKWRRSLVEPTAEGFGAALVPPGRCSPSAGTLNGSARGLPDSPAGAPAPPAARVHAERPDADTDTTTMRKAERPEPDTHQVNGSRCRRS